MSRWNNFTEDELCALGSGLGWADNEGDGSDLMDKLGDEINAALNKMSTNQNAQQYGQHKPQRTKHK